MSDTAIPELVYALLAQPSAYAILPNTINSAMLGWLDYHGTALHSYLPETRPPLSSSAAYGPTAWRASALPTWQKHSADGFPRKAGGGFDYRQRFPNVNHRWLPTRLNDTDLARTPITHTKYYHAREVGSDYLYWELAAQKHYSLLQNIEQNELWRYHFGDHRTGLWNMRFEHASINLMVIWANDVLDNRPDGWEEEELTVRIPKKLNRRMRALCLPSEKAILCWRKEI